MRKRHGLRPSIRFEIFKRDAFTCRYCGRKTPEVILEVDHIVPISDGGSDDLLNLVTSCWECNRGKAARPLLDTHPLDDLHEDAIRQAEYELQLREYNEIKRQQRDREAAQLTEVYSYWEALYPHSDRWMRYPYEHVLLKYLRLLGVEEIKDAMDIAHSRVIGPYRACRYLAGVLRNRAIQCGLLDAESDS